MLKNDIEGQLAQEIVSELQKCPLGTPVNKEALLGSLPDLERTEDGAFTIAGMDTVLAEHDISRIMIDALLQFEEQGFFVDNYFSGECRLFKELEPGEEMDLSALKEMACVQTVALSLDGDSGFSLKERTLSEISGRRSRKPVKRMELSEEQFSMFCELLEAAGIKSWKREYRPEGYLVLDGVSWNLHMIFEGNKAFSAHGSNAWPDGFQSMCTGVNAMLGIKDDGDDWLLNDDIL